MSGLFVDNDGNRSWKKIGYRARSAFAVILSLAVLLGGGGYVLHRADVAYKNYKAQNDYPGPGGKVISVEIPKGSTIAQIGVILAQNDIVKSSKAFRNAADNNADTSKIQPGEYRLPVQIPAATAITMMLDSKNRVVRQFTVPEGMWESNALALIAKKTGVKLADLKKVAASRSALGLPSWATNPNFPEGFLFPDTYTYDKNPTATEVLTAMTDEFNQQMTSLNFVAKAKAANRTPLQVLTVASILEAEVPAKYQAMVAGIIYNRIKKGMPLQLDSTSHYSLKIPMNQLLPSNFQSDTSKFNTYKYAGYPPGPIDSPGAVAMKNALNPTSSDNLYWVAVNLNTGETRFAKDLAGQNANVKLFEAWCKANKNPSGCPTS